MELLNTNNTTLFPGQRLLRTNTGYKGAEKYPMPRDCEAPIFDENEDYVYIKKTDTNGGIFLSRYRLEEDPIPEFDPTKYVTVEDFSKFREDILNGFNSLKQTITNERSNGIGRSSNPTGKQSGKSNNVIGQSTGDV